MSEIAHGADDGPAHRRAEVQPLKRRLVLLAVTWAVPFAVLCLAMPSLVQDPFVRSDDYPGLLGDWHLYYWKTLAEGRWLNYLWMLRPVLFDDQTLFVLYLALWSLVWALTANGVFRQDRTPWRAIFIATALSLMPQGLMIVGWFTTLIPATFALALYAAVAAFGGRRWALWSMFLFCPLAILSYTTYPLAILAICCLAVPWPNDSQRHIGLIFLVFCGAFVASVGMMYGLNWIFHGHFGLEFPDWRGANHVQGIADIVENLGGAGTWLRTAFSVIVVKSPLFINLAYAICLFGMLVASVTARVDCRRMLFVLFMTAGVLLAQTAMTGIAVPFRAGGAIWVAQVGFFAIAMRASPNVIRQAAIAALLALVLIPITLRWYSFSEVLTKPYQTMTQEMAEDIRDAAEGQEIEVLLFGGTPLSLRHSEVLQHDVGFLFRMEVLTGAAVYLCDWDYDVNPTPKLKSGQAPPKTVAPEYLDWVKFLRDPEYCGPHGPSLATGPLYPDPGGIRVLAPGVLGVRLSDMKRGDIPP